MRTAHSLPYGGVSVQGGLCRGFLCPRGPPPPCGQIYTCKNITLPQTSFADGKNKISAGSRIFPRGVRQLPKRAFIFQFFCRKLHENERIWTPRVARVPGALPLGSANENDCYWKLTDGKEVELVLSVILV